MSFFKKKDEDRKEAYKPSDDNVSAKEGSSGGKGGGEPAAPSVDPSTKAGKSAIKKSMDDGRFGYGYIDRNTGVEVPWYIDMINGGGANAAGDTFVSPFADMPFGGGTLSLPSNLGNAAGIAPYGYNQPRKYAQAGMQGYPTAAPAPRPTGGGSPTVTPDLINVPQDFSNLSNAPAIRSGLIGYNPQVVAGTPDPYNVGQGGEMAGVMTASQAGPSNTTMTTPAMDFMYNMAKRTVMQRYPTMPAQEQELKAQEEYNRLMLAMGG